MDWPCVAEWPARLLGSRLPRMSRHVQAFAWTVSVTACAGGTIAMTTSLRKQTTEETQEFSGELARRTLLRTGLLAGVGLATLGIGSAALTGKAAASTVSPATTITEPGWAWCYKCQGLFYKVYQLRSKCPAGGTHNGSESADYELAYNVPPGDTRLQYNWAWCNKCQGFFYGPNVPVSACPAGGTHNNGGASYALGHDNTVIPATCAYQSYWLWCNKCDVLFFGYGNHEAASICPRGGHHNGNYSFTYNLAAVC